MYIVWITMAKIQITTEDIEKMTQQAVRLIAESLNEVKDSRNNSELYKFKKKHFKSKDKKISADSIIDWLKKDTTDCAAIAAQLWPNKAEDSRRSYFYKCRDHATYSAHGKTRHYDFTKKQYLRLFGIMTNSVS